MTALLDNKVERTLEQLRTLWKRLENRQRFIAFSTGKDSLLVAAMLYEAVTPQRPICLYSHHNLEFDVNLDYLETLKKHGFRIETVHPFLGYFELVERGIGFLTLRDPWCVPMLVGTGFLQWLQKRGLRSTRQAVMFRGISGSEYSCKWHAQVERYERLELLTVNPILNYTKDEILLLLKRRYNLPLNPIYQHMDRTYCICCYTSDARRQTFSQSNYPEVCKRYYGQIEETLFGSGLIELSCCEEKYKSKEEKLDRHGFIHWNRISAQDQVGAVKRKNASGVLSYFIRRPEWINEKHLQPLGNRWVRKGNEIRVWGIPERKSDVAIKRMLNCLDCGFCVMECFACRTFDEKHKILRIRGCRGCGKCLTLKHCMGWKHRFWRRVLINAQSNDG